VFNRDSLYRTIQNLTDISRLSSVNKEFLQGSLLFSTHLHMHVLQSLTVCVDIDVCSEKLRVLDEVIQELRTR
jgi:hypothetical protein